MLNKNNTGRASSLFIVICTALVCFVIFCAYQFGVFRINQNNIEQAEFEQAYGKPRGSSPDYKEQQAAIKEAKDDKIALQKELKEEWLVRLESALQAKDSLQLAETIIGLKSSPLIQEYQVQALEHTAIEAVKNFDGDALKTLLSAGKPTLLRCGIDLRFGGKLLKDALEKQDTRSFETLVKADCMKGRSSAKNDLIAHIVTSPEPRRTNLFKALNSNSELQASVIKKMFHGNKQEEIVEYLSKSVIDKDFAFGNESLLCTSILEDKPVITQKLLEIGADRRCKSSFYKSAIVVAIKKGNLPLVEQLAGTYPEDLNDVDLVKKAFEITKKDARHKVARMLVDNNLSIIQMESVTKKLLRTAVTDGDYQQTKYLLEKGINPNQIVSRQTLLALAIEKAPTGSQEMIGLLRKHGALENVLDVARLERGISIDDECKLSETEKVDPKIFVSAYKLIERNTKGDNVSTWPPIKRCEAGIVYCKEQGVGVDACIVSVPSCGSSEQEVCCPVDLKKNYFEGRCAGLGVSETIMFLDVFSTVYGIPVNFR